MKFIANNYRANEAIKMIREHTELSQEKFATKIKKSVRTQQRYEYG